MASSWGSAWGAAWGNSWGSIAPPVTSDFDTHDGGDENRRDYRPDQRKAQQEDRAALRNSVERAFRKAYGIENETPQPVTAEAQKPDLAKMARAILPEIDTGGLTTTLGEIQALIEEFYRIEQARRALSRKQAEDETLLLLMLAL